MIRHTAFAEESLDRKNPERPGVAGPGLEPGTPWFSVMLDVFTHVSGRSKIPISRPYSHIFTLLVVSGCCSGLLSNYCQNWPTYYAPNDREMVSIFKNLARRRTAMVATKPAANAMVS